MDANMETTAMVNITPGLAGSPCTVNDVSQTVPQCNTTTNTCPEYALSGSPLSGGNCDGETVSLALTETTAGNLSATITWQVNRNGGGFEDVGTGMSLDNYVLTTTDACNGDQLTFQAVVTCDGNSVTVDAGSLTANPPAQGPLDQNTDLTTCTTTFTPACPGDIIPSYTANVGDGDVNGYVVTVTTAAGCKEDFSTNIPACTTCGTFTVVNGGSQQVCTGDQMTLEVSETSGTSVNIQWMKNGVEIPGATGTTFDASFTANDCDTPLEVYEIVASCTTGVPQTFEVASIVVFPEPKEPTMSYNDATCKASFTSACPFDIVSPGSFTNSSTSDEVEVEVTVTNGGCSTSQMMTFTVPICSENLSCPDSYALSNVASEVCSGTEVSISVSGVGTGDLLGFDVQWQIGGADVAGATGETFTTTLSAADGCDASDVIISAVATCNGTSQTVSTSVMVYPELKSPSSSTTNCVTTFVPACPNDVLSQTTYTAQDGDDATSVNVTVEAGSGPCGSIGVDMPIPAGDCPQTDCPTFEVVQSVGGDACTGDVLTTSASASGGTLGYTTQWKLNGTPIAGETMNVLSLQVSNTGDCSASTQNLSVEFSCENGDVTELPAGIVIVYPEVNAPKIETDPNTCITTISSDCPTDQVSPTTYQAQPGDDAASIVIEVANSGCNVKQFPVTIPACGTTTDCDPNDDTGICTLSGNDLQGTVFEVAFGDNVTISYMDNASVLSAGYEAAVYICDDPGCNSVAQVIPASATPYTINNDGNIAPLESEKQYYVMPVIAESGNLLNEAADCFRSGGIVANTFRIAKAGNTAPVAVNDTLYILEDQINWEWLINLLSNDSDSDGDVITLNDIELPTDEGTLTFDANGNIVFVRSGTFTMGDELVLDYTITDGEDVSNTGSLVIIVTDCIARAGKLNVNLKVVCAEADEFAVKASGFQDYPGYEIMYVLTDASGNILKTSSTGVFDIMSLNQNDYRIYVVSYDTGNAPDFSVGSLAALQAQDACFALSNSANLDILSPVEAEVLDVLCECGDKPQILGYSYAYVRITGGFPEYANFGNYEINLDPGVAAWDPDNPDGPGAYVCIGPYPNNIINPFDGCFLMDVDNDGFNCKVGSIELCPGDTCQIICEPNPGTMPPDKFICNNGTATVQANGMELKDMEVAGYILYDENGNELAYTPLAFANQPVTYSTAANGLMTNTKYSVRAIVGPPSDNDPTRPDETDPMCTALSDAVDIVFLDAVVVTEEDYYCDESQGEYGVFINISGGLPAYDGSAYMISGSLNDEVEAGNILLGPFPYGFVYNLQAEDNAGCKGSVSGEPDCKIVTPIELLDFNGEIQQNGNFITWTTASEIDNELFTLYRSTDGGTNFEPVYTTPGAGNSSSTLHYNHLDPYTQEGVVYYQLEQKDFNGETSRSQVIALHRGQLNFDLVNIVPVPVIDIMDVNFTTAIEGLVDVMVYDVAGKLVLTRKAEVNRGVNKVTLDISHYAAGVYFLSLNNGEEVVNTKFVKE